MGRESLYETGEYISSGSLIISNTSDFGLTEGRVYVTTKNQGEDTFGNCIWVRNDYGDEIDYSNEYFRKYNGEVIV